MVDSQPLTVTPPFRLNSSESSMHTHSDRLRKARRCLEAIEFELQDLQKSIRSEARSEQVDQGEIFHRVKELHGKKKHAHMAIELMESRSFSDQDVPVTCCETDSPSPSTVPLPDSVQESLDQTRYRDAEPRLN